MRDISVPIFLQAEDPVGYVVTAAADTHQPIAPGVVDDDHRDGAAPEVTPHVEGTISERRAKLAAQTSLGIDPPDAVAKAASWIARARCRLSSPQPARSAADKTP